jgi:RHS repeat-associated protein
MSRESGPYYYRARYYDPKIGRFISEDPIGYEGGDINLYVYVWNDPTDFSDSTGLGAWKPPNPSPRPSPTPIPPNDRGFTIEPQPPPQSDCLWAEYFDCLSTYYGHVASETAICTTGLKKRWGVPAMAGAGVCSLVGLYGLRELCIKKAFEQCSTCPPPKRQPPRRPPRPPLDWSPDGRPPVRGHR